MDTLTDLLAPETLGPPAELPRIDSETVVPAMPRACRPTARRVHRSSPWSLTALVTVLTAGVSLLR